MKSLTWWMRIVGIIYISIFLGCSVFHVFADMNLQSLGGTPDPESITYRLLVDTWFIMGWTFAVVGAALFYASQSPSEHTLLVWMVVAWEFLVGIVSDIYMMARGTGSTTSMSIYIVFHTVIIVWGYFALRKSQKALTRIIHQEILL